MGTKLFGLISEIDPNDPATWQGRLFLTLDVDWACDEIILDAVDLLLKADVPATWFVTHESPALDVLRTYQKFELGIHPNFNFLLDGNYRVGSDAADIVMDLLSIVPEAKSIRCHSMTQSSSLLNLFFKKGITHDCNHFVPEQTGIELRPWAHWNSLIRVPYFWEDDIYCLSQTNSNLDDLRGRDGLKVFDFHPIHVYLNSDCLELYENTRDIHGVAEKLIGYRCASMKGTRTFFKQLIGINE